MAFIFGGTASHLSNSDFVSGDTGPKLVYTSHRSIRVTDFGDGSGRKWMQVPSLDADGMELKSPTFTAITDLWMGMRLNIDALPASGVDPWIMSGYVSGGATFTVQVTPAGKILIKQFADSTQAYLSSGTPLGAGAGTYYIEVRYTRNSTGGAGTATFTVYVDGALDGSNTISTGFGWGTVDQGVWALGDNNADDIWRTNWKVADLYVDTTTRFTSRANALDGPRIIYMVPTATPLAELVPNTGTNHGAVDELDGDDDTTYVSSSTNGDRDEYTHAGLGGVQIEAVRCIGRFRATSVASTVNLGISSNGTDSLLSRPSTTSYAAGRAPWTETDPDTSSAWTLSAFNAVRLVAEMNTANTHRFTQVGLLVAYVVPDLQDVDGAHISSTATLYAPTVLPVGFVSTGTIASTVVLYPITIKVPDQPAIEATATGPRSINVEGSAYSHPDGVPIMAVEWRMADDLGMSVNVESVVIDFPDPADAPDPLTYGWSEIEPSTTKRFDVRYKDRNGNWSPRSAVDSATTDAETKPSTPTITSATTPSPDSVVLTATALVDSLGRTHVRSQWQVAAQGGSYSSPLAEQLEDVVAPLTQETLAGLPDGADLKARVRYQVDDGTFTNYSADKLFTTPSVPTNRPAQPVVVVDQITKSSARFSRGSVYSDPDGSPHAKTRIYVTNYPGGPSFGLAYRVLDVTVNPSAVPYVLSGLLQNRRHHVTIWDKAADGDWSDRSEWVEFFTLAAPLNGQLLQIQKPRQGAVVRGAAVPVSWTPTSDTGSTFTLEYSIDDGVNWLPLASGLTSSPYSWDVSGLADGVYKWRMKAVEGDEETEWQQGIVYVDNANLQAGGTLLFNYNADNPDGDGVTLDDWDPAWQENQISWTISDSRVVRYGLTGIVNVNTGRVESALTFLPAFEPRQLDVIGEVLTGSAGGSFPWNWFPEQGWAGVGLFAAGGVIADAPAAGIAAMIYAIPISAYGDCEVRGSGDGFLEIGLFENGTRRLAGTVSIGRVHVVNQFSGCNKVPRYGVRLRMTTIADLPGGRRRLRVQASVTGRGITIPEDGWHYEGTVETGLDCGFPAFCARNINTTTGPYRQFSNLTVIPYEYGQCSSPPSFPTIQNPQDCPPAELRITYFLEDDVTPRWGAADEYGNVTEASFSTDPDHPRPWLQPWTRSAPHAIDLAKGSSNIGTFTWGILDKRQDACDQGTGFLTAFLGDTEGFNQLIGRRVLAEEILSDGSQQVVHNGPLKDIRLSDKFVAFESTAGSMRERERDVPLFDTQHETSGVWPYGPVDGYGRDGDDYLIDPIFVETGTFELITTDAGIVWGKINLSGGEDEAFVVREELRPIGLPVPNLDDTGFAGYLYSQVVVRWRYPDGEWVYLRDMPAGFGIPAAPELLAQPLWIGIYPVENPIAVPPGWLFLTILSVRINALEEDAAALLPTDGADVEFQVLANTPPSDAYPFYYDGTFGEALRKAYDGDWSPADPLVGYDAECVADMEARAGAARFIIKKTEKDLKSWVDKNIFQASGWIPTLTDDGLVCPRDGRMPDNTLALPLLDAGLIIKMGWNQSGSRASPSISYTFLREDEVIISQPSAETPTAPLVTEVQTTPLTIRRTYFPADLLIKGQELAIEPVTVRVLGSTLGDGFNSDLFNTDAAQLALGVITDMLDWNAFGPQIAPTRVRDTAETRQILTGDFVRIDPSWIPNLWALRRGGTLVAQVLRRIKDTGLAWEYDLLIRGPAELGLPEPYSTEPPIDTGGGGSSVVITVPPAEDDEEEPGGGGGAEPPVEGMVWDFNAEDYATSTELRNDSATFITAFDEESNFDGATGSFSLVSAAGEKFMQYLYTRAVNGISGCRSITITRSSLRFTPVQTMGWRSVFRFSPNFETDNAACLPSDLKFIFGDTVSDESGRIAVYAGGQGVMVERPRDPDLGPGFTGAYTPNVVNPNVRDLWDGAEHVFEVVFRHSTTTTSDDGLFKVWLDGVLIHNEFGFNTCKSAADGNGPEKSDGVSFCHNEDDGVEGNTMWIRWKRFTVWNGNPGFPL